jgi:hypothetical protein
MLMGWSFAGGVKQFFLKTGSDVMTGEFEGEGFKSLVQGRQLVHCSHAQIELAETPEVSRPHPEDSDIVGGPEICNDCFP